MSHSTGPHPSALAVVRVPSSRSPRPGGLASCCWDPPLPEEPPREKPAHDPQSGRFVKGGGGRPKGSKNKATIAVENMMEGEAEAITRRCIDLAKAGDPTALKIVMDRIAPVRKGRPLQGLARRSNESSVEALLRAVLEGELTPDEGKDVVGMIESAARIAATKALSDMRQQAVEELRCAGAKALGAGVMIVPVADVTAWEASSILTQQQLKAKVRE